MNGKKGGCFTPHVVMHSLAGLGVGIILVNLFPILNNLWYGVALVVLVIILDSMRK